MRALLTIFCLILLITLSTAPALADHPATDAPESEAGDGQGTDEWLKSWGIKRNPDGSMQSMSATEREGYWHKKELNEETKQARRQQLETLQREQVEHDLELVHKNPKDPEVHFQVSINNRDRGDGEGAIIHMLKAEQLYKGSKDLRGMARARKALRGFYKTYGYLPKDFDLTD